MSTPPNQLPPVPATPDLFIPQVPFKQLPFPWNDLTNTPQPDATQYYPDHAPSVVATLAGMHPTDQQGQTVNTDGNHALLVKSVGGGDSGISPVSYQLGIQDNASNPGPGDTKDLEAYPINSTIYAFNGYWYLDPTTSTFPMVGTVVFGVRLTNNNEYVVAVLPVYVSSLTSGEPKCGHFYIPYIPAIDIASSDLLNNGDIQTGFIFNDTNGWIYCDLSGITGPVIP